jgi:hypothetical protein
VTWSYYEGPCTSCGAQSQILLQDPSRQHDPRRTICGDCQGKKNREIVGWPKPVDVDAQPKRRGGQ